MKFQVDPWAPEMGSSFLAIEGQEQDQAPEIDSGVEVSPDAWAPIPARGEAAKSTIFVDGVRRIDARIWIESDSGSTLPGYCASYAAGVVRCGDRAEIEDYRVERGVFSSAPTTTVKTAHTEWIPKPVSGPQPSDLSNGIQQALGKLEIKITEKCGGAYLTVVDGSLRGRQHVAGIVGYIKSHWVRYLPPELEPVVSALGASQRTPVFLIEADWRRFSWYLRLSAATGSPWAGIVRCEVAEQVSSVEAAALADLTAASLPGYASTPYKDSRAPQNLVPIGGLEERLKRSLGDSLLLHRGLTVASALGSTEARTA